MLTLFESQGHYYPNDIWIRYIQKCTNTHHGVKDSLNHELIKNTKT